MSMRRRIAIVRETMRAHHRRTAKGSEAEMSSISGERISGMRPSVHLDVRGWAGVLYALEHAAGAQRVQTDYMDPDQLQQISASVRRQLGPIAPRP